MILVCINPFGNFVPGDEIEAPEGAEFDSAYFELKGDQPDTKENSE